MTAEQRLAAMLALLRARVASGDVRACVLRDVEALALAPPPLPQQLQPANQRRRVAQGDHAEGHDQHLGE